MDIRYSQASAAGMRMPSLQDRDVFTAACA